MKMDFKQYLKETGTSTACVATVPMRLFDDPVRPPTPSPRKKKKPDLK